MLALIHMQCFFINSFVVVLKGKLIGITFHSLCNIVVKKILVIVPEGKLTHVRFPSWCTLFEANVVVPIIKLKRGSFHSSIMLLLQMSL